MDPDDAFKKFEELNVEQVRKNIALGKYAGKTLRAAKALVEQSDHERAEELERSNEAINSESLALARDANELASEANTLASQANRRAHRSNIIAIAAIIIAIAIPVVIAIFSS